MPRNEPDRKPPYLPYRTLGTVIEGLGSGLPTRIDRSLFPGQSGAVQGQIILALQYLDLISEDGTPTPTLEALAGADEEGHPQILEGILRQQYRFLFSDGFDLEKTTSAQLEERFRDQGLGGDTVRKGIAFFLQACEAANIPVSRHIKPRRQSSASRRRASSNGSGKGKSVSRKKSAATSAKTIEEMLLAKFPEFDPGWPEEQQKKWFDAFSRFQRRLLASDESGDEAEEDTE